MQPNTVWCDYHARSIHVRSCRRIPQRVQDLYQGKYILAMTYFLWVNLQLLFQCCVVDDLGSANDIEYIRKGVSELSVNHMVFLSTVIQLTFR